MEERIKILLINPPYPTPGVTVMPLGLCAVAAPLLEAGHEVKICDMNVGDVPFGDETLPHYDYIGVTSTTSTIIFVYELFSKLHSVLQCDPDDCPKFIIGGAHATSMPEEVTNHCDYVCNGQGDYFIWNLIESSENFTVNKINRYLDDLPIPAYHLLDPSKYTSNIARANPYATIETSRGCYGKCTYCNRQIHGNKIRFKSIGRVIEEIRLLLDLGYKEIQIMDDNFTSDLKRAKAICQAIIDQKLRFPWVPRNGIRVDRVDLELLELMKASGCYKVYFGVESGSQYVLNSIKKGISLRHIELAIANAKKAGLATGAYYMMGMPAETEEDLKATIKFAIKLNTDSVSMGIAVPLPGTEFYDEAKDQGRLKSEDWSQYNFRGAVYDHPNLSEETLKKYVKKFYRRYYFRPRYILKKPFNRDIFRTLSIFLKGRWG